MGYAALHAAGLCKAELLHSDTGVFVGLAGADLSEVGSYLAQQGPYSTAGGHGAIASNRVSYVLGLLGPSMSVDTACSSGLVATHTAVLNLHHGACNRAVAASVNGVLCPKRHAVCYKAHMLSVDGRCKTFDQSANGYVRAEGSIAVVI